MNIELIEKYCLQDDLSSYDPYDIWQTNLGFKVKNLYNNNKNIGLIPAGILTFVDMYVNNKNRYFYSKHEYPIIRALAVQILLNLYQKEEKEVYLEYSKKHIQWLIENTCKGYSGYCWGLSFKYPVLKGVIYTDNTPLATMTPYVLEALHMYYSVSKDADVREVILSIFDYLENDLKIMYEDEYMLATSYGPLKDRTVVNAVSYTMYSYALLCRYYLNNNDKKRIEKKINKLYEFIKQHQMKDGSWLYSTDGGSFIDCFHSCFVVKNIFKTNQLVGLYECQSIIDSAYKYIKDTFYDDKYRLYRRFSRTNKIGLIQLDLYDNAEMMNLAVLLKDWEVVKHVSSHINDVFCANGNIYSQINITGRKINCNTLRWAIMPFLHAHSNYLIYK